MLLEHICQVGLVEFGLLLQLFDARLVFGATCTGSNGDDMFCAKNLGGHAFVINALRRTDGFFGQTDGGEKLDGESANQQVFPFGFSALGLQMRINGGDAGGQALVF